MIAIKPEHDNFHFETRKLKQKGIGLGLYSGLENSMDHRVPRVTKNWTRLSDFNSTSLGCPTVKWYLYMWYLLVIWTYACTITYIPLCVIYRDLHSGGGLQWRKKYQPSPVFSPEESHGQRNLVGCSPCGHKVEHDWSDLACIHRGLQMPLSAISSCSSS